MDYQLKDVKDIIREILKYGSVQDTLMDADYETEKEYDFNCDRALEILQHFATDVE